MEVAMDRIDSQTGSNAHAEKVDVVEVSIPDAVKQLDLLDRIDYQDAFAVATAQPRTPEALMRDVFEGAPAWFLHAWSSILGKAILGLRHGLDQRPSPDRVVGWNVVQVAGDVFVIGLDTPRGLDARLFALTSPTQEIVGTYIGLNSDYVRRLWPAIRAGHRFFLPYLLRRSAGRAAVGDDL
jgi:hypothetical protein